MPVEKCFEMTLRLKHDRYVLGTGAEIRSGEDSQTFSRKKLFKFLKIQGLMPKALLF